MNNNQELKTIQLDNKSLFINLTQMNRINSFRTIII